MIDLAFLFSIVIALFSLPAHAASPTPISACDQTVDAHGVLVADLTGCMHGVNLARGAKLEMGGYTISDSDHGVVCDGKCVIEGPGTIADSIRVSIEAEGTVRISNVTITGSRTVAIDSNESISATDCMFIDNNGTALQANDFNGVGKIKLRGTIVSGNRGGIVGRKVDVRNSAVTDNMILGINGFRAVKIRDSVISGHDTVGIRSDRTVKLIDSTVSDNGVAGVGLVSSGNTNYCSSPGFKLKAVLKRTTFTNNGTDPDCGIGTACADLVACKAKASASTCDTSYLIGTGLPGTSLGVCSLD